MIHTRTCLPLSRICTGIRPNLSHSIRWVAIAAESLRPSFLDSTFNLRTSYLLHFQTGDEEAEGRIDEAVGEGPESEALDL